MPPTGPPGVLISPVREALSSPRGPTSPPEREHPAADRTRGTWFWCVCLGLGAVLTVAFFTAWTGQWQTWSALGLSSVAAMVVGIRFHRPRAPLGWHLLSAALLTFVAGDTTYNILSQVLGTPNPFPSLADAFYLATYPLFAAGIFHIIRARSSGRNIPALIDALIITTGLGLLSWVYVIVPTFQADGLTTWSRVIAVAYPLGDILILAMLARLVAGGGLRIPAMRLLAVGAIGLLGSDVVYGLVQLNGVWSIGGPVDTGWVIFYVGWGVAALHPSMTRLGDVVPLPDVRMGASRIVALTVVGLVAPGVLVAQSLARHPISAVTIAAFSALLFALVIARMVGILRVNAQSVRVQRALRRSSEALVAANGLLEIYRAGLSSAHALLGDGVVRGASIYVFDAGSVSCVATSEPSGGAGDAGEFWASVSVGGHHTDLDTVSVNPLGVGARDRGMLVVTGTSRFSSEQHHALSALAEQLGFAIDRAVVSEELRQRQNQEQFRSIIQNASDVIVMVDGQGVITYATPSLNRELGYRGNDILGTRLIDIVHADDRQSVDVVVSDVAALTRRAPTKADWRLRHVDGTYLFFEVLANNLLDFSAVAATVLTMRNVSERRELENQLTHQAFHDRLTGLPNRALFQDRAEHALARASRQHAAVVMAMIDLDDFKVVNDTRGHAVGDALLTAVAERLSGMLRSSSTVARLGGDEFAVLIEDVDDASDAAAFTQRVVRLFRAPFVIDNEDYAVSASVGVVFADGEDVDLELSELLRCADLALYAAKENGKARAEAYHDDLRTRMLHRIAERAEFSAGLKAKQFEVRYQPIVVIDTGELLGSEVLLRWRHPTRGIVSPTEFVALAEATGQIVELGNWVLEQACAQWRAWADRGYARHRISVNVSVRQLAEVGFVASVRAAILRHRVDPDIVVLELTESMFALDDVILAQLATLRQMGVRIAVDDFGTGYSSLSYLQRFRVDILKIDKSFVDGLGSGEEDDGTLARVIVSLASSLRLDVVAEGIESVQQRDELSAMGCRLGQGYLYSEPVTAAEMFTLMSKGLALPEERMAQLAPRC